MIGNPCACLRAFWDNEHLICPCRNHMQGFPGIFVDFSLYGKGNFDSSMYVYVPHALLVYVHLCICQGVGELEKYENVLVSGERTVGCKSSLKVAALS